MIYSIKPFALSRLTNATHIAFMGIVKQIIEDNEVEVLGIDAKSKTKLDDAIHSEEDVVNKSRKSNYTILMNEADEKRNKFFRSIHYRLLLGMIEFADNPTYSALPATIETHLIQQYPLSICNARSQDKTAKLRGLLHDIQSKIGVLAEQLNLTQDIAALKKANDEYEENYMHRLNERIDSVETATFRTATEDAYRQLCFQLCYIANSDSSTPEEGLKVETCQRAVQSINQLIKDYKSKLKSGTDEEVTDEEITDNEEDGVIGVGVEVSNSTEDSAV